jgi:hypothetical protein
VVSLGALEPMVPDARCGLCGGGLREKFVLTVLDKYRVRYRACVDCGSLQTEPAHWIKEAYRSNNLARLDTGAAQRNLSNLSSAFAVCRILRLRNVVDFGGGDGLLCRLLRDYSVNCFVDDKYATATYSQGFTEPNFTEPDLLLAFEVFEHFENPLGDLGAIFDRNPKAILASTLTYTGQGSDWWYLNPATGQHLFFYTLGALRSVARSRGYELIASGPYIVFFRSALAGSMARVLLRALLHRISLRIIGVYLRLLPTRGVWDDYERLRDDTGSSASSSKTAPSR